MQDMESEVLDMSEEKSEGDFWLGFLMGLKSQGLIRGVRR